MIRFNINKKESKLLNNNKSSCFKISYISLYTLIFVVMALFIFRDFIFEDITLIRKGDAFGQHYCSELLFNDLVDKMYSIYFLVAGFLITGILLIVADMSKASI